MVNPLIPQGRPPRQSPDDTKPNLSSSSCQMSCSTCQKKFTKRGAGVSCSSCQLCFHTAVICSGLSDDEYNKLKSDKQLAGWKCSDCVEKTTSDNANDTSDNTVQAPPPPTLRLSKNACFLLRQI